MKVELVGGPSDGEVISTGEPPLAKIVTAQPRRVIAAFQEVRDVPSAKPEFPVAHYRLARFKGQLVYRFDQ